MATKQFREKIQNHLVKGEIEEALNLLISGIDSQQQRREHDNALMLKSKWEHTKQEQLRGILSRQEYEIAVSKVVAGIQMITNEVDGVIENSKIQQFTPNQLFYKVVIAVGLLCLISISTCYIVNKNIATPVEIDNTNRAKPSIAEDKTVKVVQKGETTDRNTHKGKDKTPQNEITEKSTALQPTLPTIPPDIVPIIKTEPKTDNKQTAELEKVPVTIVLNGDNTKLKIDDENISGSGILRTRLTIGKHKFEIIEGNQRCVAQYYEIERTTKSLNLICN